MPEPLRVVVTGEAAGGLAAIESVDKGLAALTATAARTTAALDASSAATVASFARVAKATEGAAAGMLLVGSGAKTGGEETRKAGEHARESGSHFEGLAKSVALTAAAFIGAGGLLEALRLGSEELLATEKANAALANAVQNTGYIVGVSTQHLQALTEEMGKLGIQSEATIKTAESLVLSFTQVRDVAGHPIFDRVLKDSQDLAARFGQSLPEAAQNLAKALQNPVQGLTLLRRSYLALSPATIDAVKAAIAHGDVLKAQEAILNAVEQRVRGAADAYSKTFPGALDRLKNSFSTLAATILQQFTPAISSTVDGLTKQFQALSQNQEFMDKLRSAASQLGQALESMVKFAQDVSSALGGWSNTIKVLIGAWAAWKAAAIASFVAVKVEGIADATAVEVAWRGAMAASTLGLGVFAAYAVTHWDKVKTEAIGAWNEMQRVGLSVAEKVTGEFAHFPDAFGGGAAQDLQAKFKSMLGGLDQLSFEEAQKIGTKFNLGMLQAATNDGSLPDWARQDFQKQLDQLEQQTGISGKLAGQAYAKALMAAITSATQGFEFSIGQIPGLLQGGKYNQPAPPFARPKGVSPALFDAATVAAQSALIDPNVFLRQINQESGFNPNAVSSAGAIGIAQFMPGTAKGLGVNPRDPYAALIAAAQYMKQLLARYKNNYAYALAAYNWGTGAVDKWVAQGANFGALPSETQKYINSILTLPAAQGSAAGVTPTEAKAVARAQELGGAAYKWGGGHTDSIVPPGTALDCSGLVIQAYKAAGLTDFSGDTYSLYDQPSGKTWVSTPVSRGDAQPGDLVFMEFNSKGPAHMGIVVSGTGNSAMVMQYRAPGLGSNVVPITSLRGIALKRVYKWGEAPDAVVGAQAPIGDGPKPPKFTTQPGADVANQLADASRGLIGLTAGTPKFKTAADAAIAADKAAIAELQAKTKGATKAQIAQIKDAQNQYLTDISNLRKESKAKAADKLQPGDLTPELQGLDIATAHALAIAPQGTVEYDKAAKARIKALDEFEKYLNGTLKGKGTKARNAIMAAFNGFDDELRGLKGQGQPQPGDVTESIQTRLDRGDQLIQLAQATGKGLKQAVDYKTKADDAAIAYLETTLKGKTKPTQDKIRKAIAGFQLDIASIKLPVTPVTFTDQQTVQITKELQSGTRTGLEAAMEAYGELAQRLLAQANQLEAKGDLKGAQAVLDARAQALQELITLSGTWSEKINAAWEKAKAKAKLLKDQATQENPVIAAFKAIQKQLGGAEQFTLPGKQTGLLSAGNLDLLHRQVAQVGKDIETVHSITVGFGKDFYLLPTVINGQAVSMQAAVEHFRQTGENLGKFSSEAAADKFAEALHNEQAAYYLGGQKSGAATAKGIQEGALKDMPTIAKRINDEMANALAKLNVATAGGTKPNEAAVKAFLATGQQVSKQFQDALALKPDIAATRKQLSDWAYQITTIPAAASAGIAPIIARIQAQLTDFGPKVKTRVQAEVAQIQQAFQLAPDFSNLLDAYSKVPGELQRQVQPQMEQLAALFREPMSSTNVLKIQALMTQLGNAFQLGDALRTAEESVSRIKIVLSGIPDGLASTIDAARPLVGEIDSLLGGVISDSTISEIQSKADEISQAIQDAVSNAQSAVSDAQNQFSSDLNTLLDKAYSAFDAITNKQIEDSNAAFQSQIDAIKAQQDQLNQATSAEASDPTQLTPEEIAYQQAQAADDAAAAMEDQANATNDAASAAADLADAEKNLLDAEKAVNLERSKGESMEAYRRRVQEATDTREKAIEDAQKRIDDIVAQSNQNQAQSTAHAAKQATDALKKAAEDSRKALNATNKAATEDQQKALDTQIAAIQDAEKQKQIDIQSERDFEKEKLQDAVNDEIKRWQTGQESAADAMANIQNILGQYIPNIASLSDLMGQSFYDGWQYAFQRIGNDIIDLTNKIATLSQLQAQVKAGATASVSSSGQVTVSDGGGGDYSYNETPIDNTGPSSNTAGGGATYSDANSTGYGYSPAPAPKGPVKISTIPFNIRYATGGVVPTLMGYAMGGVLRQIPGYASGGDLGAGVVAGRYVGRDDTILARLTPGERVLTRKQEQTFEKLLYALDGHTNAMQDWNWKGGGNTTVEQHFHGHVWDRKQLMQDIRQEMNRLGIQTPGGIFGGRA